MTEYDLHDVPKQIKYLEELLFIFVECSSERQLQQFIKQFMDEPAMRIAALAPMQQHYAWLSQKTRKTK